jgi:hypothetical protein
MCFEFERFNFLDCFGAHVTLYSKKWEIFPLNKDGQSALYDAETKHTFNYISTFTFP